MKKSQHRRLRMPKAQLRRNRQLPQLRAVNLLGESFLQETSEAVTQSESQAEQKAEPSGNSEAEKAYGGKSSGAESPRESDNSQEENSKQEIAELKGKVLI